MTSGAGAALKRWLDAHVSVMDGVVSACFEANVPYHAGLVDQ